MSKRIMLNGFGRLGKIRDSVFETEDVIPKSAYNDNLFQEMLDVIQSEITNRKKEDVMRIFFDTEFTGLHKNTTLISIGCVDENGRTFYAEFNDYDKSQVNDWLEENVFKHLLFNDYTHHYDYSNGSMWVKGDRKYVRTLFTTWLSNYDKVQMVSDVCHYDMVLLINIFGTAFDLPNINPSCHDINQDIAKYYDVDEAIAFDKSREGILSENGVAVEGDKHNALYDAKVIKAIYNIVCFNQKKKESYKLNIIKDNLYLCIKSYHDKNCTYTKGKIYKSDKDGFLGDDEDKCTFERKIWEEDASEYFRPVTKEETEDKSLEDFAKTYAEDVDFDSQFNDEWINAEDIEKAIIKCSQWQKQKVIDKACEFLKSYRRDTPDGMGYIPGIVDDETIKDFRKAMEG